MRLDTWQTSSRVRGRRLPRKSKETPNDGEAQDVKENMFGEEVKRRKGATVIY